MVKLIYIKI